MRDAGCAGVQRIHRLHPREQARRHWAYYFLAFFLAADFFDLTGDFLAAFFFAALGMCLHLSETVPRDAALCCARLGLRTIIEEFLRLAIPARDFLQAPLRFRCAAHPSRA